jgi:hypothetical protein
MEQPGLAQISNNAHRVDLVGASLWRTRPVNTGWGGRIRTSVSRNQNPLPYHLATPHSRERSKLSGNGLSGNELSGNEFAGSTPPLRLGRRERNPRTLGHVAGGKQRKAGGAAATHPREERAR